MSPKEKAWRERFPGHRGLAWLVFGSRGIYERSAIAMNSGAAWTALESKDAVACAILTVIATQSRITPGNQMMPRETMISAGAAYELLGIKEGEYRSAMDLLIADGHITTRVIRGRGTIAKVTTDDIWNLSLIYTDDLPPHKI